MTYIAYNYEGLVVSIVVARSLELAYAYWQGSSITPHSVKNVEEDFTPIEDHITGVFPILKTKEIEIDTARYNSKKYLAVCR